VAVVGAGVVAVDVIVGPVVVNGVDEHNFVDEARGLQKHVLQMHGVPSDSD
jgi:hypothetical protein